MIAWFLEVLDAGGCARERRRLEGPVTLGRSYGSDVVLDDPAVSPVHARLEPGPGGWTVRDLGSLNGLYRLDPPGRVAELTLSDGQRFQAGRTVLRLVSSDFPVPPAELLDDAPGASRRWDGPAGAAVLWLLAFSGAAVVKRAGEFQETDLSHLAGGWILTFAGLAAAALGWTALWTLLSRLITGRRALWRHAATAGSGALAALVLSSAVSWLSFALGAGASGAVLWWFSTGAVATAVMAGHLGRGLGIPPRRARTLAVLLVGLFWGAAGTAAFFFGRRFSPEPRFDASIKPAWARLARPRSPDAWRAELPGLRARADRSADKT